MKKNYCFTLLIIFFSVYATNDMVKPRKERMSTLREECCAHAADALTHVPKIMHACADLQEEITPLLQEFIEGEKSSFISSATRDELCKATKELESLAHELEKRVRTLNDQVAKIKQTKKEKKS
jgi:hypothetical protein